MSFVTRDFDVREILAHARRIAIVGLADAGDDSPALAAAQALHAAGYVVCAVNADLEENRRQWSDRAAVGEPFGLVIVASSELDISRTIDVCRRFRLRSLWFLPDVVDRRLAERAADAGLHVVVDREPGNEFRRLLG